MPQPFLTPRWRKYGKWAAYFLLTLLVLNFVLWQYFEWNARVYIDRVDRCEKDNNCQCGYADDGSDSVVCIH